MPPLLIGPCMFAAPLVILLIPIAIVLWPVAIVGLVVAWILLWPLAAVGVLRGAHDWVGATFLTVLTPWTYFDTKGQALTIRPATGADGEFVFEMKKASFGPYIEKVWGWNEAQQREIHAKAWTA